ncbi:hypothetical protein GIB67_034743 [Kingdonia uniflora]|uniref:Uncharacterized protein n=1 Tax=Kingdonia uniflora TaxID=39325 RepID=A0A7J7MLP0_9MAGN|nr:hypothetical protein GIB67_034743 [Kingdonia uniflora]
MWLHEITSKFGDGGDFIGKSIKNDSVKDDPLDIQRREKVKEAMLHAWTSYETYAWGQDELQFRNITEVESLKSICNGEIKRRESLEFTCNSLKIDNERLVKAYTESFNKMVDQIEGRSKCVNLKEELKKLTEERAIKEEVSDVSCLYYELQ